MFHLTPWTQEFSPTFSEESTPLSSIAEKKVERIFMKFSEGDELHDTRSNLEYFQDATINPLNPESIYLLTGSVFVYNIMEKRVNGFSWNFYETSGTTQETSNGSWCMGIKGEMSGTVCVTFTWDMYIYMSCL